MSPLPVPQDFQDGKLWRILTNVIFPAAKNPQTIILALQYCERRGLDVLKRPVNIVPVWSSALGKNVETIWPSITETEITAARSRQWAGLDAPVFGPLETRKFVGKTALTVTFPQWCERTVYRMIAGERRAFTERVHWLESYGRHGGSESPNYMWAKRPHDQIAKVAKAAALRAAFPEESEGATADEMEDMIVPGEDMTQSPRQPIEVKGGDGATTETALPDPFPELRGAPHEITVLSGDDWRPFGEKLIYAVRHGGDADTIAKWRELNAANLHAMKKAAPKLHASLVRSLTEATLAPVEPPEGSDYLPDGVDPETGECR